MRPVPPVDPVALPPAAPPAGPSVGRRLLGWGIAASPLVALAGATAMARADLSPPAPIAAAVIVLPWLWGGLALLALLTAIVRRRARPAWVGLATLGGAVALYGPDAWPSPDPAGGAPLTVLTWNVHRLGWYAAPAVRDRALAEALDCVAGVVEASDADLLVLQEIDRVRLAALEARLGVTCAFVDYYATGRERAGGVAACARPPWTLGDGRTLPLAPPWHYLFAEARAGDRVINLLAVHLAPWDIEPAEVGDAASALARGETGPLAGLARQAEATARVQGRGLDRIVLGLQRLKDPTVLAGDFNAPPDAAVHAVLRGRLDDAWARAGAGYGATRHVAGVFPLRVDYVYVTRPPLRVVDARVPPAACSDHRPVIAVLGGP